MDMKTGTRLREKKNAREEESALPTTPSIDREKLWVNHKTQERKNF